MRLSSDRNRRRTFARWSASLLAIALAGPPSQSLAAAEHDHGANQTPIAKSSTRQLDPSMAATVVLTKEGEGEDAMLLARVVDRDGAAVANQPIAFSVPRLFGILVLERVETDADGIASIRFPIGLPGDARSGDLTITAALCDSETRFGEATATFAGGRALEPISDAFPRAIWASKTDLHLLVPIPILVGAVWSVYFFAISQLLKMRKAG